MTRWISFFLAMQLFGFALTSDAVAQMRVHKTRYAGMHFGDHPSWRYYNQVTLKRNADTLTYEEIRHDRNVLISAGNVSHRHIVRMVLNGASYDILYDSVFYFGRFMYAMYRSGKQVGDNFAPPVGVGSDAQFTTLESLQLYLSFVPFSQGRTMDCFFYAGSGVRRAAKVIYSGVRGSRNAASNEYSVVMLDSSNVMDASLQVDPLTGTVVGKQYYVIEKSGVDGFKSLAREFAIDDRYFLNTDSISDAANVELIEDAYARINLFGDYRKARHLVLNPPETFMTFDELSGLAGLSSVVLNGKDNFQRIFDRIFSANLSVMENHQIGMIYVRSNFLDIAETVFRFNQKTYPGTYPPLVGLARVYDSRGDRTASIRFLEESLQLSQPEAQRSATIRNIARLKKGEKME